MTGPQLGNRVSRYRWWLLVATAILVAVAGSGARHLTITDDMRVFFSERNPQLKALETLENIYTKDENVMFVLAPHSGDVFQREILAAIEELTARGWQTPYSSRVDSIANFQHSWADRDDLVVENLVENATALSDDEIARIRRIALEEPLLVNRLLSADAAVTAVNVTIIPPGAGGEEIASIAAFADELAGWFRQAYPDIDVYVTGGIIADFAFGQAGEADARNLVPIMFVVLTIIVGLLLRSMAGTVATMLVVLFAMVTGMGAAGWLGIQLTAASVGAPVIILTLAVADSVHVLETVILQMRVGAPKAEAIAESLRVNLRAVFLTSVTTAIGFLSMNFSDAPPFRDLGNIVAIGVIAAFVLSVLFLPALLSVLPLRVSVRPGGADCPPCNRWADLVIGRCRLVFWATLALALAMTAGILRIELDDDFIKYFDESFEIRRATDFLQENLTGFNVIEYSLRSGEPGGINNPGYLATVSQFADWYRTQPDVVHVNAITEIMKRLNKNMHGDDPTFLRLPGKRDLAAQYLLLYEMSLPFGLDLNNRINVDKSATRMTVILRDVTTRQIRETDTRARAWLEQNAPEAMFTYGSGLWVIWAHISERNIRNMLAASFGALVLISVILVFALRSVRLGLLSIIPNLMPALMAFGLWGLFVGQVGLGLSIIVSMTLGIVVDDTVHFLSRFLRARRELGLSAEDAVRRAFNTVGQAMWITTVALVGGFMVLAFSHYLMSAQMGLMSAMTIALALLLDFLLLPTILIRAESRIARAA